MFQYIEIFSFKMGTFPFFVGLGLFSLVLSVYRQIKCKGMCLHDENHIMQALPVMVIFGVVCAYITDVLLRGGIKGFYEPTRYGFTFLGWLSGCILFLAVYSKICKIDFTFLLNLILPNFAVAQAWGRIGCFTGGCCYGIPSRFGFCYPEGSLAYTQYGNVSIFPVQLLESLWLFFLFLFLLLKIKFPYRAGCYLLMMSFGRFILEYFRADDRGDIGGISLFSPSQLIACFWLIFGVVLLYNAQNKERRSVLWKIKQ